MANSIEYSNYTNCMRVEFRKSNKHQSFALRSKMSGCLESIEIKPTTKTIPTLEKYKSPSFFRQVHEVTPDGNDIIIFSHQLHDLCDLCTVETLCQGKKKGPNN